MPGKRSTHSGGRRDEARDEPWPRRLAAEVFGTFALVFVAAGADAMNVLSHGAVSPAARAVGPGLVVAALIYSLGDVSGAHFNPSVTIAFAARRLLPLAWVVPYLAAQALGAIAAAGVIRLLVGDAMKGMSPPQIAEPSAFVIEIVLTALLVTVILGTADRYRVVGPDAALAVGATIAVCGLAVLPVESASLNPARAIAPGLVAVHFEALWVYAVGPLVGALLGALLTRLLHGPVVADSKAVEAAQGSDKPDGRLSRP